MRYIFFWQRGNLPISLRNRKTEPNRVSWLRPGAHHKVELTSPPLKNASKAKHTTSVATTNTQTRLDYESNKPHKILNYWQNKAYQAATWLHTSKDWSHVFDHGQYLYSRLKTHFKSFEIQIDTWMKSYHCNLYLQLYTVCKFVSYNCTVSLSHGF